MYTKLFNKKQGVHRNRYNTCGCCFTNKHSLQYRYFIVINLLLHVLIMSAKYESKLNRSFAHSFFSRMNIKKKNQSEQLL